MAMQTVSHRPVQEVPPSVSPAIILPIQPDKVWMSLHLEQQQLVFRTLVTMCRSLLHPVAQTTGRREESNE